MRGANWAHRPRQLTIALRFWRMRGVGVAGPIFNHKVPCRPTPNCHVPGQRAGTVGCLHGDNQLHGGNRRLVPICRQLVMQRKQLLHEGRVLCSRAEQRQRGGAAVWHGNDRIMRRQCYRLCMAMLRAKPHVYIYPAPPVFANRSKNSYVCTTP